MHDILNVLEAKDWSIDNLVFGSGGGLLQSFNRDTLKFAIKASYAEIGGIGIDVFKDPITSAGSKTSKKGKLYTIWNPETGYETVNHHDITELQKQNIMMVTVFENGELLNIQTYDDIILQIKTEKEKLNAIH
jgi:nicotinamide phosphoribosyltransferase